MEFRWHEQFRGGEASVGRVKPSRVVFSPSYPLTNFMSLLLINQCFSIVSALDAVMFVSACSLWRTLCLTLLLSGETVIKANFLFLRC